MHYLTYTQSTEERKEEALDSRPDWYWMHSLQRLKVETKGMFLLSQLYQWHLQRHDDHSAASLSRLVLVGSPVLVLHVMSLLCGYSSSAAVESLLCIVAITMYSLSISYEVSLVVNCSCLTSFGG